MVLPIEEFDETKPKNKAFVSKGLNFAGMFQAETEENKMYLHITWTLTYHL